MLLAKASYSSIVERTLNIRLMRTDINLNGSRVLVLSFSSTHTEKWYTKQPHPVGLSRKFLKKIVRVLWLFL